MRSLIDGSMCLFEAATADAIESVESVEQAGNIVLASGYGIDIDCKDDISPVWRLVGGILAVAQAVYRRLTTKRGSLLEAPNYGYDLRELLSRGMTEEDISGLPGDIRMECLKEERVDECVVSVELIEETLNIVVHCETGIGPFDMTMSISEASVRLVEVT